MNGASWLPDVAIVGGGIVGCSIAWHLARAGASVVVLERGAVGAGASSAAAGMLAPLAEGATPGPYLDLMLASLARHAELAARLRDESGIDVELRTHGLLRLALDDQAAADWQANLGWQQTLGLPVRWLEAAELRSLVPAVATGVVGAVLSSGEHQVSPIRLTAALAAAAKRHGAVVRHEVAVQGLLREGNRVVGVRLPDGDQSAGHVVLAAGAWAGQLAEWLGHEVPVAPVKGQMLALRPGAPLFEHTLYGPDGYLVPKANGTVFVGATVEQAGFDTRVTAAGVAELLARMSRLAPALAEAELVRAWAGLRPGTPDHRPILGPVPGLEGVSLATGHYRNGILLAPITGELLAQHALGQPTTLPLEPFSLARFRVPAVVG